MSARWKCLRILLVHLLATETATAFLAGEISDAPQSLPNNAPKYLSDNKLDTGLDVLTPKSFVFWPNGTVPFYVNSSHFDRDQQVQILTTLANFAFRTCLKFMPLVAPPTGPVHALVLQNPDGIKHCHFIEGGHSRDVPHYVTLGYKCLESPNIDMMLMRALGFPFEHNRVIRDLYIDVMPENVEQGHQQLFTKDTKLPLELRDLAYDINSVTHFDERQLSKNGHKTIFIKNVNTKQRRRSLTHLDLRRIEIVYGPECLKRDRAKKIKECLPYDASPYSGSRRRKREAEETHPPPRLSLRVNPDITPPPTAEPGGTAGALPEELANRLKELGIEQEVQEIVDRVSSISSKALTDAREANCNQTAETSQYNESRKAVSLINVLETVAGYAESLVNHAVKNLTEFCQVADPVSFYQRAWCTVSDPRCRKTYFKSTALSNKHSTNYRPHIIQSTKNWYRENHWYGRSRNETDDEAAKGDNATADATHVTEKGTARRKREISHETATTVVTNGFSDVVTPMARPTQPSAQRSNRRVRFTGEPKEMYKNRRDSDTDDWGEAPRVTALHFESDNEAKHEDDSDVTEQTFETKKRTAKKYSRQPQHKLKIIEYAPYSPEQGEAVKISKQQKRLKRVRGSAPLTRKPPRIQEVASRPKKKVNRENNMEKKKVQVPKTVNLSKMNEEFYDARRWRDGVVRYIIADQGENYDLADLRARLDEVNQILQRKTCVRIQEITEQQAPNYEDYLVLDTSPDYVTGKVGGRQNFGSLELFLGGQHRQHAAMMVMAMLGFYFEVSRHDRDKYVVVHPRNIRPDKLHHFEMLREDATLDLPYDYRSATQPSWQFWRKIGKTGIATVATYKEMDPDGKIMKQLGQNHRLLSEIDLVKINSVYGIKCLSPHRGKTTRRDAFNTFISI